jgi:hypothetical protein
MSSKRRLLAAAIGIGTVSIVAVGALSMFGLGQATEFNNSAHNSKQLISMIAAFAVGTTGGSLAGGIMRGAWRSELKALVDLLQKRDHGVLRKKRHA